MPPLVSYYYDGVRFGQLSRKLDNVTSKISALKPDLIIGFSDIQAQLAKDLISANLPVLIFNQRSIQEILEIIVTIGSLVGKRQEAQSLVVSYIANLDSIHRRAPEISPRVYFEEWDEPTISAIEWVGELIEIAGGNHVFSALSKGKLAKERFVTREDIINAAPDIVFASWCGKEFDHHAFEMRDGFKDLPAVQHSQVFEIPAAIILQPGPACLTAGVEEMARHIRKAKTSPNTK